MKEGSVPPQKPCLPWHGSGCFAKAKRVLPPNSQTNENKGHFTEEEIPSRVLSHIMYDEHYVSERPHNDPKMEPTNSSQMEPKTSPNMEPNTL